MSNYTAIGRLFLPLLVSTAERTEKMADYISKRILVSDLTPGLEIGKAVITEEGTVVLTEGTVLTPSLIERLRQWGIQAVNVRQEITDNIAQQEPVFSATRMAFCGVYDDVLQDLRKAFETMRYRKEVPLSAIQSLADKAVNLSEAPGVMNYLHLVKKPDEYTYRHSLNVGIITGLLGRWMDYSGQQLKELILAGLMHDIGKTQIPIDVLNKPGKLSPEELELVRKHTTRGYNLIKASKELSAGQAYGILQHHERIDGSGYPLGVPGEKIHPYARIVAVADIFDAMSSERFYQKSVSPFDIVQTLVREMFNKLDPQVCTVFLNNVRDYFVGSIVRLYDGRTAEVLYIAPFVGAKPILRTRDGEVIDLEKRKDVTITSIIYT